MGAQSFVEIAKGDNAKEAFTLCVEEAMHECGHGGYTGSIAEKRDFVMIRPDPGWPDAPGEVSEWSQNDYEGYAWYLVREDDHRIADKWGPAGCMELGDGEYLFFGWASS